MTMRTLHTSTWMVLIMPFLSSPWLRLSGGEASYCPTGCSCRSAGQESHAEMNIKVSCTAKNLTTVPSGLSVFTTDLDLSMNHISGLWDFSQLTFLQKLRLAGNEIENLSADTFLFTVNLQILDLRNNKLSAVPGPALQPLQFLQQLNLGGNKIEEIPKNVFGQLHSLSHLYLSHNKINQIHDNAFQGLDKLKVLYLSFNNIIEIPKALKTLSKLEILSLEHNEITFLPEWSFCGNKQLRIVKMNGNPLISADIKTFMDLPSLQKLKLSSMRNQEQFLNLEGTFALREVFLDRASILSVPDTFCRGRNKLIALDVHSNQMTRLPDFKGCSKLSILNLGMNRLQAHALKNKPFLHLTSLVDLILSHNALQYVPNDAFTGLGNIRYLDLQNNHITLIEPEAFSSLTSLNNLNLGENQFKNLPTKGLQNLQILKTFNNRELQDFPPVSAFPNIEDLTLSYAYHCCGFVQVIQNKHHGHKFNEETIWLNDEDNFEETLLFNISNDVEDHTRATIGRILSNFSSELSTTDANIITHFDNLSLTLFDDLKKYKGSLESEQITMARPSVKCKPMPGPFMPCSDLLGWWSLRCGIWLVFLLSFVGNAVVLFVLIFNKTNLDVPQFLICNLACADFFMGMYLGFLALIDLSTLGTFKKHAIRWQMSPGCSVAGFLAVFSSELSVYTLALITLERYYTISNAVHVNRRLSLKKAGYITSFGWFISIILGSLPLFGVSDYRRFAICLPFRIGDSLSLGYVCFIMMFNCAVFIVIIFCYTKMYCSIRQSPIWNSTDSRIARRMAILVFTDFACWAPIIFFSLASILGYHLLSLEGVKVLTVFVLPLNSCANPFLYVISTKQFRKDLSSICRQIRDHTSLCRTRRSKQARLEVIRHPSRLHSIAGKRKESQKLDSNSLPLVSLNSSPSYVCCHQENGAKDKKVKSVSHFSPVNKTNRQRCYDDTSCVDTNEPSNRTMQQADVQVHTVTLNDSKSESDEINVN